MTPTLTRRNIFGTGINLLYFGTGFPWKRIHYGNFPEAAEVLVPLLAQNKISEVVIPDFTGMNALLCEKEKEFIKIHQSGIYKSIMRVDAIVDTRPALAITADCHTVVLIDKKNRKVAVLHCGRDALQPFDKKGGRRPEGYESVIDTVCRRLWPTNPKYVYAFICCGIGKESFENRENADTNGFYKKVVDYFIDTCGTRVLHGMRTKGHLDMPRIIKTQLGRWGIPAKNIEWDRINTFSNPEFNSRRRSPEGCNGILVDTRSFF